MAGYESHQQPLQPGDVVQKNSFAQTEHCLLILGLFTFLEGFGDSYFMN